ncbi:hypothetical protein [Thiomicrospira pelophila]|uniref:hypothetical protein n=1 Tax=Thiomicrospira pelophila TaxID=934 RepID=UPI0004A75B2B|nr:hypothetical protein [Thiomicrospira pelophila]
MNQALMDIDLLSSPSSEPMLAIWQLVFLMLMLIGLLIGLTRWLRRSPGLVVWRWQRQLARLQTDQQRKQLALEIYDWLAKREIPLDTDAHQALLRACFSEHRIDSSELAECLTALKAYL